MKAYSVLLTGKEDPFPYLTEEDESKLHDALRERFGREPLRIVTAIGNREIKEKSPEG